MLNTAIILAGGFGTRLQTVVSNLPKPMAPVNGIPFLNYQLQYLKHFGVKKIIFSVGYLFEKIQAYYKSEFNDLQIEYVIEEKPLGTGGGIRLALEECTDDLALVLNGDSFFDVPLTDFIRLHQTGSAQFSLALRKVENSARYGTIEVNTANNRIRSFKEKANMVHAGLINGGVYILEKQLFLTHTPADINFSIEKDFFETQLEPLNLNGYTFEGYFIDIGIPEDYHKAQHDFKTFKY
jgi:D-glycero-alpha-D-manno-heptose 1-phosphate guanylyltransferase